jgi:hypothetical protein
MRPLTLALIFWLLAVLFMSCDHASDCLCDECEIAYYAERERGMK